MRECGKSPTGQHEFAVGRYGCVFCNRGPDDEEMGRRFLEDASPPWMKRGKR